MSDIAIKVENISKRYQIGENKQFPTLRDKIMELPNRLFKGPKKTKEFWALKDVSFEVKKGEIVGIIGRNGAGKSTLLKILARITEPTSGQVTMYGRVASMLEVGTGFNQELTGRENIYLNGAIIGMTKKEIQSKFDDIVEFSGVGKFLDTPVKRYSSGMYVRLAFAVAAHLDADILLVDEVLAVGDAEFQKKCLGKMSDLADSGKTVIFVSHNINAISSLCSQAILLSNGELNYSGGTSLSIEKYLKQITPSDSKFLLKSSKLTILKLQYKLLENKLIFMLKLKFIEFQPMRVGIGIKSSDGITLCTIHHRFNHNPSSDSVNLTFEINNIFNSGTYLLDIGAHTIDKSWYDFSENAYTINIVNTKTKDYNKGSISPYFKTSIEYENT